MYYRMGVKRRLSRGRNRGKMGGGLNFDDGSVVDDSEAGTDNVDVFERTDNSSLNPPNMSGVDNSESSITQGAGSSRRRKRRRTKKTRSAKRSAKRSVKRRKARS